MTSNLSNLWKICVALGLLTASAPAASLTITNHSFENPVIPTNSFSTTAAPPGWTAFGSSINYGTRTVGVLNPNGSALYFDPVPHGQNVAVIFLWDNTTNPAIFFNLEVGLRQTLTNTLRTHTRYVLRTEVGNIAPIASPWNFTGFPNYRIDLLAGTNVLASDLNTLLPAEGRYLSSTVTLVTATTHPLAGQALGIRLVCLNSAPGVEVNFDNVRLDATPEPARISAINFSDTNATLAITNLAGGATHRLARSEDFGANLWTNLTTFIGQTTTTNLFDPLPPAPAAIYRVLSE